MLTKIQECVGRDLPRNSQVSKLVNEGALDTILGAGSNPVLTTKNKFMREALKVIFLFKKPTWDDYRLPYILLGIIGWLEIISIVIVIIN